MKMKVKIFNEYDDGENLNVLNLVFTFLRKYVNIHFEINRLILLKCNDSARCIYMNGEAIASYEPRQVWKEAAISSYWYVLRHSYKCILRNYCVF